jgi:DNA polymerase III delta subunit-like protein
MMESLRCRPFFGSGWKVLVVNEADAMTPNAAFVWLDALEDLPPQTVIIFTTNAAGRIPARLRDRCERLTFESSALLLRHYLQELTDRIWREEGCAGSPPEIETLGVADDNGNASFRRLIQKLTPYIRAGAAPAPKPIVAEPQERLHIFGRRWAGGERITQLAKEAGTSWNRLWSELTKLGYKTGA